jgi:hypothetical protein
VVVVDGVPQGIEVERAGVGDVAARDDAVEVQDVAQGRECARCGPCRVVDPP